MRRTQAATRTDKAQLFLEDKQKFGEAMIQEFLEERAEQKRSKYGERAEYPFTPLVLSAGGWLHPQFYDYVLFLKGRKFLRSFYQELALSTLRARTINFRL